MSASPLASETHAVMIPVVSVIQLNNKQYAVYRYLGNIDCQEDDLPFHNSIVDFYHKPLVLETDPKFVHVSAIVARGNTKMGSVFYVKSDTPLVPNDAECSIDHRDGVDVYLFRKDVNVRNVFC